MMILAELTISNEASPQQLIDLFDTLEHWCNDEVDSGECCPHVDRGAADDLRQGELPQPRALRLMRNLDESNEMFKKLFDKSIQDLDVSERKKFMRESGEFGKSRTVSIFIEGSEEFIAEDAVGRLRDALSEEIVTDIRWSASPDPDCDDTGESC